MKFTQKQNKVLSEIYRRLNYFHEGDLNTSLLHLSLPSDVKSISDLGILKPYAKEIPRSLNWYNLTEKGKKFFSNYVTKHKLSNDTNTRIFNGESLMKFNASLLDV